MGFYTWILIVLLSFGIQSILYAKYSRKYGGFWVGAIRNISMILTGIPFVMVFGEFDFSLVNQYWIPIVLCAMIMSVNNILSYEGFRFLPVGISQLVKNVTNVSASLFLSLLILSEVYSSQQGWGLLLIIGGSLLLAFANVDVLHLKENNIKKGMFLVGLSGILTAVGLYFFNEYNLAMNSMFAAYVLEASIGMVLILYIIIRKMFDSLPMSKDSIEGKDVFMMSAIGLLPLLGSFALANAFLLGGFGLTSLILVLSLPISFGFGRLFLGEKIRLIHVISLIVVMAGLVVMKM